MFSLTLLHTLATPGSIGKLFFWFEELICEYLFSKESLCEGIDFDSPEETSGCVRFWVKMGISFHRGQNYSDFESKDKTSSRDGRDEIKEQYLFWKRGHSLVIPIITSVSNFTLHAQALNWNFTNTIMKSSACAPKQVNQSRHYTVLQNWQLILIFSRTNALLNL